MLYKGVKLYACVLYKGVRLYACVLLYKGVKLYTCVSYKGVSLYDLYCKVVVSECAQVLYKENCGCVIQVCEDITNNMMFLSEDEGIFNVCTNLEFY